MRAASTGGGPVRLVVIWLVVLAALVMTAAGASSTSAAEAAIADTAAAGARHAAAATPAAASAAAPRAARGAPAAQQNATAGRDDAACEPVRVSLRQPACAGGVGGPMSEGPGPPPYAAPWAATAVTSPTTAATATASRAQQQQQQQQSANKPSPVAAASSRCPAATCARRRADNNNNYDNNDININNKNNNDNDVKTNKNNNNNNNYNNNNSNHQCLEYARPELMPEMCPDDPGAYRRPGRLSRYRLRHCCHHTVESVVQQPYADKRSCDEQVRKALDMDDIAAAMSCQFNEVLARYDCQQKYSAMSCDSCKDAYALWACAAVLPHWTRTTAGQGRRYRVNACRSVCLDAEQKCPWLLPVADDANPYAGEAAFTCIDPDIGFQLSAADAREDCCYEHCADRGGLCVRNATACGRDGDDAASQRPVCVETVPLVVEESECTDYSLTDSGGRRPTPAAAALPFLLSALSLAARSAAVT